MLQSTVFTIRIIHALLLFCICINPATNFAQQKPDTVLNNRNTSLKRNPEIFSSGFLDVINNGQINASARMVKLMIGEPQKFSFPLSFYSGVSSNNFQNPNNPGQVLKSNDHLFSQYMNPLSGLINVSIEGIAFRKKDIEKITRCGLVYQLGERVLTGIRTGDIQDPRTGQPVNFLNAFITSGTYFQTGAWEKNDSKNMGVFWLVFRYHACKSNPSQIRNFLRDVQTNGFYHGYSIGLGIQVNKLFDVKAIYYQYAKAPELDYQLPIYQFSINYTLEKNQ